MSTVEIKIAGTNRAPAVLFSSCYFMSAVNGMAGEAKFRIRDPDRTLTVVPGSVVELLIDSEPVWYGFVTMSKRVYAFPAIKVTEASSETRFLDIEAADLNVLFQKRIAFNQSDPENVLSPLYGPNTPDTTAITDLLADWLDLSGDGLDTTSGVVGVADINEDQQARAWSGSDTWGQAMASIAMLPAAIYYLRPNKELAYVDTDTPDAPFGLSDQPDGTTTRGYREMEILLDGSNLANDVMCWGIGYGSATPVFERAEDATSQLTHGRWQLGQVTYGIYKQATIDRVADSILNGSPDHRRGAKDDRPAVTITTYEPGLLPAQKVAFESTVFDWDDVIPIRKMEVTFDAPDTPKYVLMLSHEIDTPWSFFDPWRFRLPPLPRLPPIPNIGGPGPPTPGVCFCGITDSFDRTVVGSLGRSDFGVDWEVFSFTGWDVAAGIATAEVGMGDFGTGVLRLNGRPTSSLRAQGRITVSPAADTGDLWAIGADGAGGSDTATLTFSTDGTVALTTNAGTASDTLAFDATVAFNVYLLNDGAEIKAKVWLATDPEPAAWTLTQAVAVEGLWDYDLFVYIQATTGDVTGQYAQINAAGIDRCVAPLFDDFERTEASDWGSATPGGQAWTQTAGVNSTARVEFGSGIMENALSFPLPSNMTQSVDPGLTPGADFSATIFLYVTSDSEVNEATFIFDDFLFGWEIDVGGTDLPELVVNDVPTGGFRVTVPFDATFWANLVGVGAIMKAERRGATARLKLWDSALAEPDWMLVGFSANHDNPPSTPGAASFASSGQHVAGVQSVSIFSIDFGYDGRPCYDGCDTDQFTNFDTFNRSVAGSWGATQPGGLDWTDDTSALGTTTGVDGAAAFFDVTTPGAGTKSIPPKVTGVVDPAWCDETRFTLKTRFRILNTVNSVGQAFIISLDFQEQFAVWVGTTPGIGDGGFRLRSNNGTAIDKVDWQANEWYNVSVLRDFQHGVSKMKLWLGTDTEPDWQIVLSDLSGPFASPSRIDLTISAIYDRFECAWIDCDIPICLPVYAADQPGGPVSGPFTEFARRLDALTYQLSRAIAAGTTQVSVGTPGVLYVPDVDYTVATATGQITFTNPLPDSTIVSVTYVAAGPLVSGDPPPSTNLTYVPRPTIPALPGLLAPVTDPTWGTTITRISTAGKMPTYSRVQGWNSDQTKLLLGFVYPGVMLDGADYSVIDSSFPQISNALWSNTDPNVLYGVNAAKLVRQDATTGSITSDDGGTVRDFAAEGYTSIQIGGDYTGSANEGGISDDDRYICLTGYGGPGPDVFVYDIVANSILGTINAPAGLDNAQISRLGNYVVVQSSAGSVVYDQDLTNPVVLDIYGNHGDNALDGSGNEIFVTNNAPGVVSYDLATGVPTTLLGPGTAFEYGHTSGRNFGLDGWVTLSNYDTVIMAGRPGRDQLVMVNTDGSGEVRIFGFANHVNTTTYAFQPHASASRDGLRVLFGSEWGGSTGYAFVAE